jgi:GTP pyrophosphokinase
MSSLATPLPHQNTPAANAAAASFAALTAKLDYLDKAELTQLRQAYRFADEAHLGQLRSSGEPYITHPIAVAQQCAEWRLDVQALMAALLHDAMEDCGVTKAELIERFGAPVAELVDGLTKLDKLQFGTREEGQAESFRKMLLAMTRDVRVILIKLADRTHNMRTLSDVPRSKWARIAGETMEIYAPIAHRLGLNQTYRELQDLAFRHLQPWRYQVLSKAVERVHHRQRDFIQKVQGEVQAAFAKANLPMRLSAREKTLHAIYRKMDGKRMSFAQVNDIYGARLILRNVTDCYTALGVLHQLYKPVPGRFKDHIAIPKTNAYQSLHTTLVGPSGVSIEFQMRTEAMDMVAESGIAAHWLYKTSAGNSEAAERLGAQLLQSLLDIQSDTRDAAEFLDHVKVDLFPDAVYVFTPKSRILALPRGATVVDFAYAIHSNVGDRAVSAIINGQQVPLRTELVNGDVVEVVTAPVSSPNPAWLSFVRTARARAKIRQHLKTLAQGESEALGEKLLAQALRSHGYEPLPPPDATVWSKLLRFSRNRNRAELLVDIGMGRRIASIVGKRLGALLQEDGQKPSPLLLGQAHLSAQQNQNLSTVHLDGREGGSVHYATCCHPIPGDKLVAYLGRGDGLLVHTAECKTAKRQQSKNSERFIPVEWSDDLLRSFEVGIVVTVQNGKGVLAKVAAAIAEAEADISHVDMGQENAQESTDLRFTLAVRDRVHLAQVLRSLKRVSAVLRAQRQRA